MSMSFDIITDAIPRSLCLAAEAAWPGPDWAYWHRYNGATANKFGSMDRARIPAACLAALDALALAVIPHIGDSFIDYDLHAAGCHQMPPGGFLARHLDAESHPIREWRRTHSIVMGVNSSWNPEHGGKLVIESPDGNREIAPEPGQAIIFETAGQWHEVTPVASDANQYRKTLALFAWDLRYDHQAKSHADFSEGMTSAH
jgi:Rps23 Pro-64 3,4-dihydroxylase Tpa1-like proline 4-hydroxylase